MQFFGIAHAFFRVLLFSVLVRSMNKKRLRQSDVAKIAGVSPATVSLVINNRAGDGVRIADETRQRVLDTVSKLGYVVDPAARSLAGGRNRILGVYSFEAIFPIQHHNFYYPFLVGIEEAAEELGYDLLLFTSARGPDGARSIYRHGNNRLRLADGAVLLGVEPDKSEVLRLVQEGYPFVFVGRREVPGRDISYVGADYAAATKQIIEYLFGLGHRIIAYVGQTPEYESQHDRFSGFCRAYEQAGIVWNPALVQRALPGEFLPSQLADWLDMGVTAIAAGHDSLADDIVRSAAGLGKAVPDDLSIVVLGDSRNGNAQPFDFTSFIIPRCEMGFHALHQLIELLTSPDSEPRQLVLACAFSPGVSAASPRQTQPM